MKQRLPIVLSVTALVVALLGTTPVGQASSNLIQKIPPFAKQAGFAKLAGTADNAKKLGGHRPSEYARLDANGKLSASIGAVGPKGDPGRRSDRSTRATAAPRPERRRQRFRKGHRERAGPGHADGDLHHGAEPAARSRQVRPAGPGAPRSGRRGPYSGFCQIVAGTDSDTAGVQGAKNAISGGVGSGSNVFVSVIHQFTAAGAAELKCWSPPAAPTTWSGAKITAIQIASTAVKSIQP